MDKYTNFYIDKTTQPFADMLVAFGLARIIAEMLYQQNANADVTIHDRGRYMELICSEPLHLDTHPAPSPIPLIKTVKNADSLPVDAPTADYEAIKEDRARYFAERENNPDAQKPDMYWDIYRAINPAALPGYNGLVAQWWQVRDNPAVFQLMLDLFSLTPNPVDEAMEHWKALDKEHGWNISADATCQQLYNPDQGKGQNKTKSNGLSIGNVKNFWLIEYLKMIGLYEGGITKQVRGGKDRKSFIVAPRELTYSQSSAVLNAFYDKMSIAETSTRFDILAATRYTRALLEHFSAQESRLAQLFKRRSIKRHVVSGFHTAFYKDLGNAVATMNLSFIALPGWVNVSSREDIALYTELLQELEQVTRQFEEKNSDAFSLLQSLRDFVSGDDLSAFFRFTNAFPAYYMGMKERNKYAIALSTSFIERLIMSTDKRLSRIIDDPGFKQIAYAIRESTVIQQHFKKQNGKTVYEIRYGLGHDLVRNAKYPENFIVALSDFLHKYNAETARVNEVRKDAYRKRYSVEVQHIDSIVKLIDEYGSEPVANLLVAYGYASAFPKSSQEEPNNELESTEEEE